jgi:hypothetical protein
VEHKKEPDKEKIGKFGRKEKGERRKVKKLRIGVKPK